MDRQIVYPGSIPLDTDVLNIQRNIMITIGALAQVVLGTNIVVDGLLCSATQPASMMVSVGPGSITQYGVVDSDPFGSLPALDAPLLRIAASITPASFLLTAPSGAGQAINYLIEASFLEADATPVVLPYYDAVDPAIPYSGPNNSGAAQNTQRLQQVQLQLKAGAPAPIGTQSTPPVDSGWAGLYVITVVTGQSTITAANIVGLANAPFISWKLPQLSPGTQHLAAFTTTSQGNWTVPAGVSTLRLRLWGGGGAGGAGEGGAGGGGAAGGYSDGYYSVVPGQTFAVTVGGGGIGGAAGGPSAVGSLASVTGGQAGGAGASGAGGAGGALGGTGLGSNYAVTGQAGGAALLGATLWLGGAGGAAFAGGGAMPVAGAASGSIDGQSCSLPGGGGGGGVGGGLGGQGGAGLVFVEW